jgi:hypothetical protein
MTKAGKSVCRALVAAMILLPMQAVRADMIAVERALADQHQAAARQLQAHGISSDEARERVAAMTDEEAAALSKELETLPAGGNAVFAFLAIIFFFAFVINQMYYTKK